MEKRGRMALVISVIVVVILIVMTFFYWALFRPGYSNSNSGTTLLNPASNMSLEEAISNFNESFVKYVLYSIKAYDLHNPPLSKDYPKIGFSIGEDNYLAVIQNGVIIVTKSDFSSVDAIIKTDKTEAVKMVQNKAYIQESFSSGRSSIELKAGKATLFSKGYLNLYTELTGKSITGNVIRIYAN